MSVDNVTKGSPARRWLALVFSLGFSALALYFVFRKVDGQVLRQLIETQDLGLLAAAAFFILLQIALGAERWRAILSGLSRGQPPSLLSAQAVFYGSIFFNVLPVGTLGGDVARMWLARGFGLSIKQLVMSILIDRMMAVAALVLLGVIALPTITHPLARVGWLGSVIILMAGVVSFLLLSVIERMLGRWRHRSLVYLLLRATEELRYLKHRGGLPGLFWAMLSAASGALAGYCVARSLGIGVGPIATIAVMSMVTLLVALPISLGGWGVREVSLVALLGLLGVDRASALLMSVEFGLLSTLLSLPGGVVWLVLRGRRDVAAPTK